MDQHPASEHDLHQHGQPHHDIVTGAGPAETDPNQHYVYDGKICPLYDMSLGHYAACEALVQKGYVPDRSLFVDDWANVTHGLKDRDASIMTVFWQHQVNLLTSYSGNFKVFGIPLARIRKLMKTEELVQMVSVEVLPLMAQAADLFVTELTMRAWMKARDNSRRTLQRSDIIQAAAESDMYDFLIDFLPREARQEPTVRRPSYSDPTLHIRQPSMPPPPLMHTAPTDYLPPSHPHLPQVGVDYQSGVGAMYGGPTVDGDRTDPGERKAQPLYSHNLYDSLPGAQRSGHRPPDQSL